MEILLGILKLILALVCATIVGKGISKLKMPAILGWLITGMILGPYALNLLSYELLEAHWYEGVSKFLECAVGLMFAKELIFKKLKTYGKQIMTITIFESAGTFIVVSTAFAIVFHFMNIPWYLSIIFGGIALATAPAPALSIVSEFKTKGPMTSALIPIAMLDDVVAMIIFFSVNSFIMSLGAGESTSVVSVVFISIFLPVLIGMAVGFLAKFLYQQEMSIKRIRITTICVIAFTFIIAQIIDNLLLPTPMLNYMLVGMAVFTTIANLVQEHKIEQICDSVMPLVGIALITMIMNLGAPLDYRLIMGAGTLTFLYILFRACGKYFCTYLGAKVSKAEPTVKKYLGFVLLPHSGVSLVFTAMAMTSLNTFDTESALILQGTIAAAAVINEIFAVIIAKKGFEWGGEISHGAEIK